MFIDLRVRKYAVCCGRIFSVVPLEGVVRARGGLAGRFEMCATRVCARAAQNS